MQHSQNGAIARRKKAMKSIGKLVMVSAISTACAAAEAGVFTYSQNFDSMGTSGGNITGARAAPTQGTIPGLDGNWRAARIGGSGSITLTLIADDGNRDGGGIYNYGAPAGSTGDSNRSLGSQAGTTAVPAFGLMLENTSGAEAISLAITFDAKQFRRGNNPNNLTFAYGVGNSLLTSTNFLSSNLMTALAAGDVVGGPGGASEIISPPTTTAVSFTIASLSWASGDFLFLRWQDTNDTGFDAGLAIDNFSLTATLAPIPPIPAPGAIALLGMAGLARRRRRAA